MSLQVLIHTVSQKINQSEEVTFEKLLKITEIVKNELFSVKRLIKYNFSEEEVNKILTELIMEEHLSPYFAYSCEHNGCSDIAVSMYDKCDFCGNILREDETNHTIQRRYKLNSDFIQLIKDKKESNLQKYVSEDYKLNLQALVGDSTRIVPFLGAGISVPLGLPDWKGLLECFDSGLHGDDKYQYQKLVKKGSYLRAITFLQRYSGHYKEERIIKRKIKQMIEEKYEKGIDTNRHNVKDILNLGSSFYITTNYDMALTDYRSENVSPYCLNDIEDIQDFIYENKQRVIHLHGHVDKPSTMIVTQGNYEEMYDNAGVKDILKSIMGNKKFLFIGFSFNDEYFKDLYEKIIKNIGGEHYIITPNLHVFESEDLSQHHLIPIGINVKEDNGVLDTQDYVKAIKTVLEQLL
ncbi:SIR2 family protein [Bacillus cereus]|nr:SIR2 family protein [Bacillus cereus]